MDLAKIRQKARYDRELLQSQSAVTEAAPNSESTSLPYIEIVDSLLSDIATDFNEINHHPEKVSRMSEVTPLTASKLITGREELYPVPLRDPLEIILAGRVAAGCDEELPLASTDIEEVYDDNYLEFLCFRVSDEYYGINIMDIKEIIKPRDTTEVPRSPSFVSGVISLRGIIIPIIDMLDRLGLSREKMTGRERVIVVKLKDALSGLLVDEIVQVVRIAADTLESAPAVLDGIDRDFVTGIGRSDGKMIIILNLETVADINLF